MNTRDRDDLLFLYCAGALEGPEQEDVEAWLATGESEARDALARAESEIAALAATQPGVAAPAAVRERLLARARGERLGASAAPARSPAGIALAAGLAGLLVAGAIGFAAQRATREEARSLAAQLAETRTELLAARDAQRGTDEEIAELEARMRALETDLVIASKTIGVLRAEEAESLALAGTGARAAAHGRVFWDWEDWYCYLHVVGLEPRAEPVYALWLFTEDGVVPVGTFHADATGEAVFLGPVPHDVGHVLRAGISLEPDEDIGSRPRGDVVLVGEATPSPG